MNGFGDVILKAKTTHALYSFTIYNIQPLFSVICPFVNFLRQSDWAVFNACIQYYSSIGFCSGATKVMLDRSVAQRSFCNLKLSYRGAERQPPSALTLALTFSAIMKAKSEDGSHAANLSTDQRLQLIVQEWHNEPGVISKWHLDEGKQRAILNLLVGTTPETRSIIQQHLHYFRWKESALSSDLLKSTRWLLGAAPKQTKDEMKRLLTVTASSQEAFILNYIDGFCRSTRRVKPSARSKLRATPAEWDRLVDYTCIMQNARVQADALWAANEENKKSVGAALEKAFMARP